MRMWIGLFMVMTFPAIGTSDGYWNVIQRNVWDAARYVQQNQSDLWSRAEFVVNIKSGCPCGCGCKDCDPSTPCDCGCECGLSYYKINGYIYEYRENKLTGNAWNPDGKKCRVEGFQEVMQMAPVCRS